jgi:putative DNA primase/helicase
VNAEPLFNRLAALGADVAQLDVHRIGVWQRLSAGKRGSRPIAVKIHRVDPLLATVGDWRQGDFQTVRDDRPLSSADRARLHAEALRARRIADEESRVRQAAARMVAQEHLRAATPARADHPYLARKGVRPHGIFAWTSGDLLIPMFDRDGGLWSHQTIYGDGRKLYLKHGRRAGCFFLIGKVTDRLVLAEGYATAASVYEGTGWPVAVCFDAHGLVGAGAALRLKYPRTRFIFAADDDSHLPVNIGVEAARTAAANTRGLIVIPQFHEESVGTDWNDYATRYGLDALARAMTNAVQSRRHG